MSKAFMSMVTLTMLSGAAGPFDDGAARAPAGTPLHPRLLSGYAARPPWRVAGVDFAVGLPDGTVLKKPATIAIAGVTLDTATHAVKITASNVVLNGYDFGPSGGWGIYIESGATNTVIENCEFLVGRNGNVPISTGAGAGNLTVRNSTFDGGGGRTDAVWALIDYKGQGTFIAQFDSFLNAPSDAIDFGGGPMTSVVEYNLFDNLGTALGTHPDAVQFNRVTANNSIIAFNTIYQPNPMGGMQGVQLEAQGGSTLVNTLIQNNVIVAKGPGNQMSYSIAVIQDPGNTLEGAVVAHNYIDYRGAFGPIYTPSGSHLTYEDNVNMVTGAQIPGPSGTSSSNVVSLSAMPASGTAIGGSTITLTLRINVAAAVTGAPLLTLNTGGLARFSSGSGTDTLVFRYRVGSEDKTVTELAILRLDLPARSSLQDWAGNRVDFAGLSRSFPGLSVSGRRPTSP